MSCLSKNRLYTTASARESTITIATSDRGKSLPRPGCSTSDENSRTKVQNVLVDSTGIFDDGTGMALYVSGVNGFSPNRLYKWDGHGELSIASEHGGSALALQPFDDGTTSALYMGGGFMTLEGVPASNIARWSGCTLMAVVPAVETWGLVILTLTLISVGSIVIRKNI